MMASDYARLFGDEVRTLAGYLYSDLGADTAIQTIPNTQRLRQNQHSPITKVCQVSAGSP
jgi:hypothetical protein